MDLGNFSIKVVIFAIFWHIFLAKHFKSLSQARYTKFSKDTTNQIFHKSDVPIIAYDSDVAADRVYFNKVGGAGANVGDTITTVRKDFPETWIWEILAK